ncbi:MAG: YicC family protein [Oscillospiraceae bacterium]|nr:YicC family protein [Oscillospiraceae bacterium]
MTGYGNAKVTAEGITVSVELKSVNNRYLETSVRLPRVYLSLEEEIKNTIKQHISRGKVDVFITIDSSDADTVSVTINRKLAQSYVDAFREIGELFSVPFDITSGMMGRLPDVFTVEKTEADNSIISGILSETLLTALDDFDGMRAREGEKLLADIRARLLTIGGIVDQIELKAEETLSAYRNRLEQKMNEVLSSSGIDESRILSEAAIFADRIAIDEETVRLRSHISQMESFLETGSPIGKKMDFLIQEFNREANTIGSKCQNSDVAHTVVELKSEIEKIREQIQNIE